MHIVPPVFPFSGFRGVDSWGVGGYGSPRDGGKRKHLGLDFLGKPGDTIVATIGGRIDRLGHMYAGATEMRNIHIIGTSEYAHYSALLGYVTATASVDTDVQVGAAIGTLQDVAGYWAARRPSHYGAMKNHCHMSLRIDGTYVDPGHYLPTDLPIC